ncbi:hypothetical protein DRF59_11485 [Chryseobacterium flavum]|uniref:Uncharacterized protein n=1 Tax=Chryseobacterium flavum TaxID=415851 RepID=A0A3D9CL58_9FLAO|nr:class I lanthipeptide [Chryseobacterium flavum]REC66450.1 hypothetical protein DRF59_11485 [Chryseobacterium flavum]
MSKKKLTLKKEKITSLTKADMESVKGGELGIDDGLEAGGTARSSNNDFTCCWCTGGGNTSNLTYCPQTTTQPTYTTNSPYPTK